jgi:8-amino-3,8-dideoxy-alpha-D-manno-octulosonate transaminase
MTEKLAICGGTPVRTGRFPEYYPGASRYDKEEENAVLEVIRAKSPFRYYGPGPLGKVTAFEKAFCREMGVAHALGVTSGTAALVVALKAAGVGPGDKVIVPACTFIATAGAVVSAGAVPIFGEIDESLSLDPDRLEQVIDPYTKAIIPVPILGNPCQMDRIMEVAKRRGLMVIEDVAQSCGASYRGKKLGTFGHIGAFSLQINKIITTGDGGAVVTNDPALYERAVRYHDHGMFREKEGFLATNGDADIFIGQNYRMSEIIGAVAGVQLGKLAGILRDTRRVKYQVREQLKDISGLQLRRINDEEGDAGNALIFLLDDGAKTKEFVEALRAEGIPANRLYNGEPVYAQPQLFNQKTADLSGFPFNQFDPPVKYTNDMCPVSKGILARNVTIMTGSDWTEREAEDIVTAVKKVATALL